VIPDIILAPFFVLRTCRGSPKKRLSQGAVLLSPTVPICHNIIMLWSS